MTCLRIRHRIGVHNLLQQYPGYQDFNVTNHYAVYVFDVADGLKASREGYALSGTGSSVESP